MTTYGRNRVLVWAVGTAVVLVLLALTFTTLSSRTVLGKVESAMAWDRGRSRLLVIHGPGAASGRSRVLVPEGGPDLAGIWVLALGEPDQRRGGSVLLCRSTPEPLWLATRLDRLAETCREGAVGQQLRARPVAATVAGIILLLAGFLGIRILGAAALGTAFALASEHAVALVRLLGVGQVLMIDDLARLAGAAAGAWLGAQPGQRGYVTQRLGVASALVVVALGGGTAVFGWSSSLAIAVVLLGTAASPAIGLGLLTATLLANGLAGSRLEAYLVLVGCGLVVRHLLHLDRLPSRLRAAARRRRSERGELPPDMLLEQRR